jgi:hypothetical protein
LFVTRSSYTIVLAKHCQIKPLGAMDVARQIGIGHSTVKNQKKLPNIELKYKDVERVNLFH